MNKTKRYLIKRIVSCILAFVMLFEMCPISTYPAEKEEKIGLIGQNEPVKTAVTLIKY